MDKKTQMWIGVAAVAGIGIWLLNRKPKDKIFANLLAGGSKAPGCKFYAGSCNAPVGTIITSWENGGAGIIVANNSTRCLVCPKSDTPSGMPKNL